jgi:hypothetical protein
MRKIMTLCLIRRLRALLRFPLIRERKSKLISKLMIRILSGKGL